MRTLNQLIHILLLISLLMLTTAGKWGDKGIWGRANNRLNWGQRKMEVEVFNPDDIEWSHYFSADLGAESDSSTTPADSGDVVYFWRDQSGNSNDAAQGSNSARPMFKTGVHNGNNGLTWDSNNDLLNVAGDASAGERTYVWVMRSTEGLNSDNGLFSHGPTAAGEITFYMDNTYHYVIPRAGTYYKYTAIGEAKDGNPHVWMSYWAPDFASWSSFELWCDNTQLVIGNHSDNGVEPWSYFRIGFAEGYGGYTISELAVYQGSLTTAEITKLRYYWNKKYGIAP